jgi:hypothetical protein
MQQPMDNTEIAEKLLREHKDFKAEGFSEYMNGYLNGIIRGLEYAQKETEPTGIKQTDAINYYNVPPDKIGLVLCHLNSYGWKFKATGVDVFSIDDQYVQATSRDWDGHKCIFRVEQWKGYKFISITSDLIMKENKQTEEVYSYQDFKARVGLEY